MSPAHINARMRRMLKGKRECAEIRELFSDYVDAELEPDALQRVEAHVGFCRPCRQVMKNLRQTLIGLRGLSHPPHDLDDEAVAAVDRLRVSWRDHA